MPALEKFTKLRDGDAWVLEEQTPEGIIAERLDIVKNALDHDPINSVVLYLWGTEDENNPYVTPKDFLVSTIKRVFREGGYQVLVEDKFIDPPVKTLGVYCVTVNKGTNKQQTLSALSEDEVILHALEYLPNSVLVDIINSETMNAIVNIYCRNGNPCDLTVGDEEDKDIELQQIGYAIVDMILMGEESVSDDPADVVKDFLEDRGAEETFGWEYSLWDDTIEDWIYIEDGGEFVGDDPTTNGFFDFWENERHVYWQNAELDEWIEDGMIMQDQAGFDWPDDYDDDDDGMEDDDDDWFDDGFITEEVV